MSASDLRSLVRDFLDKVQDLEPGSTVAVYLAGHGVQLEGENYLLPVDARIERDVDVPSKASASPTSFAPSSAARLRRG